MNLIKREYREELHKYITGVVQSRGSKMLAIFCMPDHAHVFIGLKPSSSISDLVRDIKTGSSNFINSKKWVHGHFNWQEGFGAFSYSRSQVSSVCRYIQNQEVHHSEKSFKAEYLAFLDNFEVEYDDRYLFDWLD